mmetsp:Transcript_135330/g.234672  ORF Transcript_135330/g.234672 Transcript_135330/m.234672 type:complete len:90 (-) Transcript_135330:456-725(-)
MIFPCKWMNPSLIQSSHTSRRFGLLSVRCAAGVGPALSLTAKQDMLAMLGRRCRQHRRSEPAFGCLMQDTLGGAWCQVKHISRLIATYY